MNQNLTIHILDETTANKIAAGEVVERPASVVKELVENSIDAQSSKIEVEISEGGIKSIRVTDDGIGMGPNDAKLAILRHATSKIHIAEDLTSISSLGFRGEALPSIASVSKFTMTTRLHSETFSTLIAVQGGKLTDVREAGSNVGTTITIEDLFYNTPARQKFLKTTGTESGYISNILIKLALSHPETSFRFINNKKLVFATPGTNKLDDAIASVYGHKIAKEILPISFNEDGIEVTGYLSKPSILKSNRNWQTFVVNSRVVQSRFISKAIDSAYHSLLPKIGYPLVVINVKVPIDSIDVNVHPQKSEVKFSNEQLIYRLIYRAVSNALKEATRTHQNIATSLDVPRREIQHGSGIKFNEQLDRPAQSVNLWKEELMPFSVAQKTIQRQSEVHLADIVQELSPEYQHTDQESLFQPLGQIDECYIVARAEDGLYIIDQHAAHERILYDRLCNASGHIPVQQLLTPIFMNFDAIENSIIESHLQTFKTLGFTLEQMGPNTARIVEVPADIPTAEAENIIREILAKLADMQEPEPGELRHACLQTAACRAAIKAGDSLNMRQIKALVDELFRTKLPYTCPHGRPAIVKFGSKDLAKMFKRT